ncbi:hypothetical protein AAFF_G00009480 [Aldrovandia affinis]|uniref:Secretin receptor n=1 Tax=Aldrovandia affinis TaxID=143900 RepID=A0AAD7T6H1_9TELE|nr:hypothetical protein AAFF_G00009480 [Aldrovandia affinis]
MKVTCKMRKLALLTFLLDVYAQGIPPECEPHNILVREEESCYEELQRYNLSKAGYTQPGCRGMWDHLNCWPHTLVGNTISQPCPKFLRTKGRVFRNCTAEGWTEAFPPHEIACEYAFNETLVDIPQSHQYFLYVRTMYTVGYAFSLVSLAVAIFILCLFRKLHCTRNYIHIQLFLSFILRAAFIFIRDSVLFSNEDFYHCGSFPVGCKLVVMASHYCIMANYSWLLVEGHYLHTLVHISFFSEKKYFRWYIVLGWGLPMIVIVAWGMAKYLHEDEGCWEMRNHDWIWWILRVPVLLFIVINLLFFLSIIRILVEKLRTPDVHANDVNQYKRLAKSTFLLVSLFGLHYILFAFSPVKVNQIWNSVELALSSVQGFVVAVLYCFLNGEVQYEFQRKWRRWRLKQHLHGESRPHHCSLSQSGAALTQVSLLHRGSATRQVSQV